MAPSPAETRRANKVLIRDIRDGREVVWNVFQDWSHVWPWIERSVADQFECQIEDVDILETEAGDLIAIDGRPVAYVDHPSVDFNALHNAAFPMLQAAE